MKPAIKYGILFIILIPLPGNSQQAYDSLMLDLPDTSLSVQNTLYFLEESAGLYFSYNPGIFGEEILLQWSSGTYPLASILQRIVSGKDILYTQIGNQLVFYRAGEESGIGSSQVVGETSIQNSRLKIRGHIIGAEEETPLPYATLWVPSTWEGTIANSDGFFAFSLPADYQTDTLAISCMGFETKRVAISRLHDSINTIYLNESLIPIQEVVIRRTNPLYLLRLALSKIPENNSRDAVVETAFYRESVRKNGDYVSVSEAVVDVYKPGYESMSSEQVRLLRARNNVDYSEVDTLMIKIKAGLETSFLLDIIRNRPEFLQLEFFRKYSYQMTDIVVIQDHSAYAIDFSQKAETDPPHYRGRIYIDMNSFALRAVEFSIDPETISSVAGSMVLRKPRNIRVRPLSAEYYVSYKAENGLYHVSQIRAENRFRIRERKKLFGNEYFTSSEMAVTRLQTDEVNRFRGRETINPKNVFAEQTGGYEDGFWGPYNYIIPEESLEEALIRIASLMRSETE